MQGKADVMTRLVGIGGRYEGYTAVQADSLDDFRAKFKHEGNEYTANLNKVLSLNDDPGMVKYAVVESMGIVVWHYQK